MKTRDLALGRDEPYTDMTERERPTSHGRDAVGGLWVLEIGLEVREGVISEGGIHEGGAARVLEEGGFHGVVEMQR